MLSICIIWKNYRKLVIYLVCSEKLVGPVDNFALTSF